MRRAPASLAPGRVAPVRRVHGRSWETLLVPYAETVAAAEARVQAAQAVLRGSGRHAPAWLDGAPELQELQVALADLEEARQRRATWDPEESAGQVLYPLAQCSCSGAPVRDRGCLGCRRRSCAACQPEGHGAPCRRCEGPVWLDGEPRPPERRDPRQMDY